MIAERAWYEANPDKGYFIQYPIIGNVVSPNFYSEKLRLWMAKGYEYWNYDNLGAIN